MPSALRRCLNVIDDCSIRINTPFLRHAEAELHWTSNEDWQDANQNEKPNRSECTVNSRSSPPLICDLPSLVSTDDWFWQPAGCQGSATARILVGHDKHDQRWLTKVRGREYGLRELAFARLAQRLGWSCQSSIFVRLPPHCPILTTNNKRSVNNVLACMACRC